MWASSNPILANNDDAFSQFYGKAMFATKPDAITLQGVVNKTAILVGIAIALGAVGYALVAQGVVSLTAVSLSVLASMLVCFGVAWKLRGNPAHAPILAPIYAAIEGLVLGALSGVLDGWLAQTGAAAMGGVALQAFIITISIVLAMLGLYSARILKPTKMLVSIVSVATAGIMITYLLSWPLAMFGVSMPFISLTSAFGQGWTPFIGLGINVFILGIASLWLIIDFKMIEDKLAEGGPRYMEWYCGFALLVTLAWIYYEAVKLAFRIAVLLNSRD